MKRILTGGLCMALIGAGAAAEPSMTVSVRGINLHSRAGAAVAIQRMQDAATAFCGPRRPRGQRDLDFTELKCRRDMTGRAVRMLNSPDVASVYDRSPSSNMFAAR